MRPYNRMMAGNLALYLLLMAGPTDPLVGDWTMNSAQSHFAAGFPPLRSQTMTCRPRQRGIWCETLRISASGRRIGSRFYARYDGREYPVLGSPEFTGVRLERLEARTVRGGFTRGAQIVFAYRIEGSVDGRHLTIRSIDPQSGKDLTSVVVYDRK